VLPWVVELAIIHIKLSYKVLFMTKKYQLKNISTFAINICLGQNVILYLTTNYLLIIESKPIDEDVVIYVCVIY
jgi:hypothetical protein